MLVSFCPLDTLELPGKKESQLWDCVHQMVLGVCLWDIFLVNDCGRRIQPTVGDVIPGQMILGGIKNQSE